MKKCRLELKNKENKYTKREWNNGMTIWLDDFLFNNIVKHH